MHLDNKFLKFLDYDQFIYKYAYILKIDYKLRMVFLD